MEGKEKNDFMGLMNMLGIAYGREVTKDIVKIYWLILEPLHYEDVKQAILHYCRLAKKDFALFPKTNQIFWEANGDTSDAALLAWGSVMETMRKHGAYQSIIFEDPYITKAILALGGWRKICMTDENNLNFVRKDFIEQYTSLANRVIEVRQEKLCGEFERMNSPKGITTQHIFVALPKPSSPENNLKLRGETHEV